MSNKEKKLIELLANEGPQPLSVCAERLNVTEDKVRFYLERLGGQAVLKGDTVYLREQVPEVRSAGKVESYVIFDLETTSTDTETTELLEIAALKVTPRGEERFSTFVKPSKPPPKEILELTGITVEQLKSEGLDPALALSQFFRFCQDLPWVGHNIRKFDVPILKRLAQERGLSAPDVPIFDTLDLAHIACWDDPRESYSQDHLTLKFFGETPQGAHRAIVDVESTYRLMKEVYVPRLLRMSRDVQLILRALVPETAFVFEPTEVTDEVIEASGRVLKQVAHIPQVWSGGRTAKNISELLIAPRPGQQAMAEAVRDTLDAGGAYVVEAPTGTGKTRAYLYPALISKAKPVYVSTYTKQLQNQILQEAQDVAAQGFAVKVVASKGASNYICPDRLAKLLESELSTEEKRALALLILEAKRGEFDEVPRGPLTYAQGFRRVKQLGETFSERCSDECEYCSSCAYWQKQKKVAEAQVVVVNHALALHQWAHDEGEGEEVKGLHVVFDEAHDLEEAAYAAYRTAISTDDVWAVAREAYRPSEDKGLLTALVAHFGSAQGAKAGAAREAISLVGELYRQLREWTKAGQDFVKQYGSGSRDWGLSVELLPSIRATTLWARMENLTRDILATLRSVKAALLSLGGAGKYQQDVEALLTKTSEIVDGLYRLLNEAREGFVYALEADDFQFTWWMSPLWVSSELRQFWPKVRGLVLTSATLRLKGSGEATGTGDTQGYRELAESLALPSSRYKVLEPVLPYEKAHLFLTTHLPLPMSPTFSESLGLELHALLDQLPGKTLGLFTANARLVGVSRVLASKNLDHLSSRRDGKEYTASTLKDARKLPLHALGSAGFMQGLDVPDLSLVHLEKTPFPVPTLLLKAQQRALGFEPWWNRVYLPKAVLRFVQAFGRLIRNDRKSAGEGAFVIWDKRLAFKPYVAAFIEALPSNFPKENLRFSLSREEFYDELGRALGLRLEVREALRAKEVELRAFRERLAAGEDLLSVLNDAFGVLFERSDAALKVEQSEAMRAVFAQQDLMVVLPTGSGKSLIFQLPALLQEGYTLVLSPLVALIQDQVGKLQQLGLPVAGLWGGLPRAEQQAIVSETRGGRVKLLYVAPERLRRSHELRHMLKQAPPVRVVLDEAHCLSEWGHDFRPDYLKVTDALEELGITAPITALTATATPHVREEMVQVLRLSSPLRIEKSFDRPNLHYVVHHVTSAHVKDRTLVNIIKGLELKYRDQAYKLVIYAGTRDETERLAALIGELFSKSVAAYHAGLSSYIREELLEAFLSGDTPFMVATNAFGMGVDAPDIRAVIHYNAPLSLEAYVQEAGRAGRDGEPAYAITMWHRTKNKKLAHRLINYSYPTPEDALKLLSHIQSTKTLTLSALADETKLDANSLTTLLHMLEVTGNLKYVFVPGFARLHAYPWTRVEHPWLRDLLSKDQPINLAEVFGDDVETYATYLFDLMREHQVGVNMLEPCVRIEVLNRDVLGYKNHRTVMVRRKMEKFQHVETYANAKACRRRALSAYFEEPRPICHTCELCASEPLPWEHLDEEAINLEDVWDAQKEALLLVVELLRRKSPRGFYKLRCILLGQEGFMTRDKVFEPLSVTEKGSKYFGRLRYLPVDAVTTALENLRNEGFIEQEKRDGKYDVLVPTEKGRRKAAKWMRA